MADLLSSSGAFMQQQQQQQQQQPQQQQQQQHEEEQEQEQDQEEAMQESQEEVLIHQPSRRFIIYPIGTSLEPSNVSAKCIKLALQTNYKKCWPAYGEISKDAARLGDIMSELRKKYRKDPNYKPKWMDKDIWDDLMKHWPENPSFQKRSAAGKKNRASEKLYLKKKYKRDLLINELHKELHILKGTTDKYCDQRSEKTQRDFDMKVDALSSTQQLDQPTAMQIWKDISGKPTSKKAYGAGCLAPNLRTGRDLYERVYEGESTSNPPQLTLEMRELIVKLTQQLQTQSSEIEQERKLREESHRLLLRECERRRAFEETVNKMIVSKNRNRRRRRQPSPAYDESTSEEDDNEVNDEDDNTHD